MPHLSNKKHNALHSDRARESERVRVCSSDFRVHNLHQHIWIEHAQMSFAQSAIFNTLPMLLADRIVYTLSASPVLLRWHFYAAVTRTF